MENSKLDSYKPLLILAMIMTMLVVLPIPIVFKLSHIGTWEFSVAVIVMPFFYSVGGMIAEIYGLKIARQLIVIALFLDILFSIFTTVLIHLPSPANWLHQQDYNYVLGSSLMQSLLGAVGIYLSQYVNLYALTKWKILLKGRYFGLRSVGSSALGELIISAFIYFGIFE